jgi:inner membrane protein
MPPSQSLLAHRGFTHSFTFLLILAPLLGFIAKRLSKKNTMSFYHWTALFGVEMLTHVLIDSLTTYGTGWFEPFSHQRITFDVIFVADPFYTIWLLIPAIALLVIKSTNKSRRRWITFGLITSTLYIVYCVNNKAMINTVVKNELNRQQINYSRYMTTPSPLNNWLWYIIAETDSGYYTGYHSVFDKTDAVAYHFFPRNDSLIASFRNNEEMQCLIRFSQGYYTIENRNDTLVFNDLRFGQVAGWDDPNSPFVFDYYLKTPGANRMIVQHGRFATTGENPFRSLVNRIKGR